MFDGSLLSSLPGCLTGRLFLDFLSRKVLAGCDPLQLQSHRCSSLNTISDIVNMMKRFGMPIRIWNTTDSSEVCLKKREGGGKIPSQQTNGKIRTPLELTGKHTTFNHLPLS
ncbi:MAG: hypothetical protein KJO80_14335 [Gammaproteobacteria bacterium]|nr:hypothetical protein [Gammaproteobacteria bacterium]NNK97540.1 hypothetical protein [Xanthomonadales bacterium]